MNKKNESNSQTNEIKREMIDKQIKEFLDITHKIDKELSPYTDIFEKLSDRDFAILSTCILDSYLERILAAFFINDNKVKHVFKDDHLLQSFYAKFSISYFCGLLPKWLYHDLKLIGEIRNKFAHELKPVIHFNEEEITRKINKCELRPKAMDDIDNPRMKFRIIIMQATVQLIGILGFLTWKKPAQLIDIVNMNEFAHDTSVLTKNDWDEIDKKLSKYQ